MESGELRFDGECGGTISRETANPPFNPDLADFIFAVAAFVLGYLFSRWVFFSWKGWTVFAFTVVYLLTVSAYLIKKGAAVTPAAAFWFALTLFTGASFALWSAPGLDGVRPLFLFCSAVYFTLTASGRLMLGKTGNYLLLDGINAVLAVPFRNFILQYMSFKFLRRGGKAFGRRWHVILGAAIAVLLIMWMLPMLELADSGGFSRLTGAVSEFIASIGVRFSDFLMYAAISIPMAAYICGLVSGCANGRKTDAFRQDKTERTVHALRVLPPVTVTIALAGLCALYLVFIACQIPYFFSAFTGGRPDGYLVYSEYARRGFFELCRIAAINLAVITAGNVVSKKRRRDFGALRALNVALSLITLLLIATAMSKMALYIDAYGLSILRLLPCVFMLFLAAVFAALIAMQWKHFSIVRAALVTGGVMMCALCLANPDAIVARYNAGRYISGTLAACDVEIFERAGPAGVLPAIDVLNSTDDEALKLKIREYLYWYYGEPLSYETYRAAEAISGIEHPR